MHQDGRRALIAAELDAARHQIGQTPLVRLRRLPGRDDVELWAKLESQNPGGSAKDRTAVAMLRRAWNEGVINPSTCIVESSSGNLGVALARWCRRLGLSFHCVVDDRANAATVRLIEVLGARVHRVNAPDPATGGLLAARQAKVRALIEELPQAVWLNQYANPAAVEAHADGTMREIAEALDHRVDQIFVAVSTTGTFQGCAQYVTAHHMPTTMVAVDACGSVLFGGESDDRQLTGFGAGTVPDLARGLVPDEVTRVTEVDTVLGCRLLAHREAIVAGASGGAVVQALLSHVPAMRPGTRAVIVLHDGGVPYLPTVYDDAWVAANLGVDPARLDAMLVELAGRA